MAVRLLAMWQILPDATMPPNYAQRIALGTANGGRLTATADFGAVAPA